MLLQQKYTRKKERGKGKQERELESPRGETRRGGTQGGRKEGTGRDKWEAGGDEGHSARKHPTPCRSCRLTAYQQPNI